MQLVVLRERDPRIVVERTIRRPHRAGQKQAPRNGTPSVYVLRVDGRRVDSFLKLGSARRAARKFAR